jgi:hypothetical protein
VPLPEVVERLDRAQHGAVVVRADEAADPVAGPPAILEQALLDALPVGVLEQAARDPAVAPTAGGETAASLLEAPERELEQAPAVPGPGERGELLAQTAFLRMHRVLLASVASRGS